MRRHAISHEQRDDILRKHFYGPCLRVRIGRELEGGLEASTFASFFHGLQLYPF
jgi:hypothetical protein